MAFPWFFAIPGAAAGISILALWVIGRFGPARDTGTPDSAAPRAHPVSFLFDGDMLLVHDVPGGTIAHPTIDAVEDWTGLRGWLCSRFDGLPETLTTLKETQSVVLQSSDPYPATLTLQREGTACRVILSQEQRPDPALWHQVDRLLSVGAYKTDALNHVPCAVWITSKDDDVIWQNDVFGAFSTDKSVALQEAASKEAAEAQRRSLQIAIPDGPTADEYYEVVSIPRDACNLNFATNVTAVVGAEIVRREFVQTLTKTFANLTTGLAVFNRARELALFNPALVDLTMLPVEFLSSRPTLLSFFDNLRDYQVMPEPKSYPDWRGKINHMIESASGGRYSETWNLPSGLTYRVTGRPHPDGAIAFLFEDISDEISSNRHYRAQLDLRHAVLDRLDEAVAVFGPNRSLVFCNEPLASLLNINPDNSFAELSFDDLLAACRAEFPSDAFWDNAAQSTIVSARKPFVGHISDVGGTTYQCRLAPLPGETTMLCLRAVPDPALSATQALT